MTGPYPGITTVYEFAMHAVKKYATKNALGTRKFLGWKNSKVKEFAAGDNAVTWTSFEQVGQKAHQFGAALRAAGLQPAATTTSLDRINEPCRIAIFENTCAPWFLSAVGAFTQSISVVTVYATLGMDSVKEAVQENEVRLMVCNKANVAKLLQQIDNMPSLKYLVYTNDLVAQDDTSTWPDAPEGVNVIAFDDFVKSGDVQQYPPTPPQPSTCAVVMYTSGSTGKPKGVIMTHSQVLASCVGVGHQLEFVEGKDVYLAYLPLAHILEFAAEMDMFCMGATLCYADPKSLSATGAYPVGAMEIYKPTVMAGVPKIWDVIKKGVEAKVAAGSPVAQFLVQTAMEWRGALLSMHMDTILFKALVFKKLGAAVGGELRIGLCGGGPLDESVQNFIRTAFGFRMVIGYVCTHYQKFSAKDL